MGWITALNTPAGTLLNWAGDRGIRVHIIQPGKPQQHAYIERYNRTAWNKWLDQYMFATIKEVQDYATRMALDLQQRPPQHGARRDFTRPEIETANRRVNSTSEPR